MAVQRNTQRIRKVSRMSAPQLLLFAPRAGAILHRTNCEFGVDCLAPQAVKMGIPIVCEKYLLDRLKAGKDIDHVPYLMEVFTQCHPMLVMMCVRMRRRLDGLALLGHLQS